MGLGVFASFLINKKGHGLARVWGAGFIKIRAGKYRVTPYVVESEIEERWKSGKVDSA